MIMQSKSIYNPTYKPLFINEIDKEDVKDFSTNLSNKLRQIKLAISKANINKKPVKNKVMFYNQTTANFKNIDNKKINYSKSQK
jgi:hypothetical protein